MVIIFLISNLTDSEKFKKMALLFASVIFLLYLCNAKCNNQHYAKVFLIFTNFDISAGRKAGTKKQSLVPETLYIKYVTAFYAVGEVRNEEDYYPKSPLFFIY